MADQIEIFDWDAPHSFYIYFCIHVECAATGVRSSPLYNGFENRPSYQKFKLEPSFLSQGHFQQQKFKETALARQPKPATFCQTNYH